MSLHIVTGYAADGRSTIISRRAKSELAAGGFDQLTDDTAITASGDTARRAITNLYASDTPHILARPMHGEHLPIATRPGGALWLEMKFEGHYETEFHRTDSIDFHCIVAGEVELILEDAAVTLRAGDTVMLPGVVHKWRSERFWHSNLFVIGLASLG